MNMYLQSFTKSKPRGLHSKCSTLRVAFRIQYARTASKVFEIKIVFAEKNFGKETYFGFLRHTSQDELEVSLFNTPKLARGLFLGAGYFWVSHFFYFAVFRKN